MDYGDYVRAAEELFDAAMSSPPDARSEDLMAAQVQATLAVASSLRDIRLALVDAADTQSRAR